jgi:hypothetical protein
MLRAQSCVCAVAREEKRARWNARGCTAAKLPLLVVTGFVQRSGQLADSLGGCHIAFANQECCDPPNLYDRSCQKSHATKIILGNSAPGA